MPLINDSLLINVVSGSKGRTGVLVIDETSDYHSPMPREPVSRVPNDTLMNMQRVLVRAWDAPMWFTENGWSASDPTNPELYRVVNRNNVRVVPKFYTNAFDNTELEHQLRDAGVKAVVVMGYHANQCVKDTVGLVAGRGLLQMGFNVLTANGVLNTDDGTGADWHIDKYENLFFYTHV
jgi:nicotinamidase-related amidase